MQPQPGNARDANLSKKQQLRSRLTLYLFYCDKRAFSSISNRPWGEEGAANLSSGSLAINCLSKLPPPPGGWTPEVASGDLAASGWQGLGPCRARPLKPRETSRPVGPGGGGASRRVLLGRGGAGPPHVRHHWPHAPDWRVHVTGWAHPLGNVFSLLHS